MPRKSIAIILVIAMIITLIPANTLAAETQNLNNNFKDEDKITGPLEIKEPPFDPGPVNVTNDDTSVIDPNMDFLYEDVDSR